MSDELKILKERLKSKDKEQRLNALNAISSSQDFDLDEIFSILKTSLADEEDHEVLVVLVPILMSINNNIVAETLPELESHEDGQTRSIAAAMLGKLKAEIAVEALKTAFIKESDYPRVTEKLFAGLSIPWRDEMIWAVMGTIAKALGRIGNDMSVKFLIENIQSDDIDMCRAALLGLTVIKHEDYISDNVPLVVSKLSHNDSIVRKNAVLVLKNLSWQPPEDDAEVTFWVANEDWEKCVSFGKGAIPALIDAFSSIPPESLSQLVDTLARLDKAKATEQLIRTLNNRGAGTRIKAAEKIAELKITESREALVQALEIEGTYPRKASYQIPGLLGGMLTIEDKSVEEVKQKIAAAISKIEGSSFEQLMRNLQHADVQVREEAIKSLVSLDDDRIVAPLITLLKDTEKSVRWTVSQELRKFSSKEVVEGLIAVIRNPNEHPDVRWIAGSSLSSMNNKQGLLAMVLACADENPDIRDDAVLAVTGGGMLSKGEKFRSLRSEIDDFSAGDSPSQAQLRCGWGSILGVNANSWDAAEQEFRQAIRHSDNFLPHALLGDLLMRKSSNLEVMHKNSTESQEVHAMASAEIEVAARLSKAIYTTYYSYAYSQWLTVGELREKYTKALMSDKTHSLHYDGNHWSYAMKFAKYGDKDTSISAFVCAMILNAKDYEQTYRPDGGNALVYWNEAKLIYAEIKDNSDRFARYWPTSPINQPLPTVSSQANLQPSTLIQDKSARTTQSQGSPSRLGCVAIFVLIIMFAIYLLTNATPEIENSLPTLAFTLAPSAVPTLPKPTVDSVIEENLNTILDNIPSTFLVGTVEWMQDVTRGQDGTEPLLNITNGIGTKIYYQESSGGEMNLSFAVFNSEDDAEVYYESMQGIRQPLENGHSEDLLPQPNLFGTGLYGSVAIFQIDNLFVEVNIELFSASQGNPLLSTAELVVLYIEELDLAE